MISNVHFANSTNGSVIIGRGSSSTRMLLEDCMFNNITTINGDKAGAVLFGDADGGEAIQTKLCTINCYGTSWAHFSYVWAQSKTSKQNYFNQSSLNLCGRNRDTGNAPYEMAYGKIREIHMNVSNTITQFRALHSMFRKDEVGKCSFSIFLNNTCQKYGAYHAYDDWGIEYCVITKNTVDSYLIYFYGGNNINITKCIFSYNQGKSMFNGRKFNINDTFFYKNDEDNNYPTPSSFNLTFDISNKCPETFVIFKFLGSVLVQTNGAKNNQRKEQFNENEFGTPLSIVPLFCHNIYI